MRLVLAAFAACCLAFVGVHSVLIHTDVQPKVSARSIRMQQGLASPVNSHFRHRKNKGQKTSQPLNVNNYNNVFEWYTVQVSLGTPPQNFTVLFDTGSANLWVTDASCDSDAGCLVNPQPGYTRHFFNDSASRTLQVNNTDVNIGYGAGDVDGFTAVDVLTFAGLTYKTQMFALITEMDGYTPNEPFDGILGAGWPALSENFIPPPINNILPQLDQPVFTVYLGERTNLKAGTGDGSITYGGEDTTHCKGPYSYVWNNNTNYGQDGFWLFYINGYSFQDIKSDPYPRRVLLDTGTPGLVVSSPLAQGIIAAYGAEYDANDDVYLLSCNITGLANIELTINGASYEVPPSSYIFDVGRPDGQCVLSVDDAGDDDPNDPDAAEWTLGDAFMRAWCTAFDIGQNRIGFAPSLPFHN